MLFHVAESDAQLLDDRVHLVGEPFRIVLSDPEEKVLSRLKQLLAFGGWCRHLASSARASRRT